MKSKAPLPFLLLLILVPILVTSAEASALAPSQSAARLHRRHLDGKKGCPSGTIEIPDGSDGYCQCCSKANERICLKMIVQCSNSSDGGNCKSKKKECCSCVQKCKKEADGDDDDIDRCIRKRCKTKAKKLAVCKFTKKSKWRKAVKKFCGRKVD